MLFALYLKKLSKLQNIPTMRYITTILLLITCKLTFSQAIIIIDNLPAQHPGYDSIYLAADTNYWNPCNPHYKFTMNNSGKMQLTINNPSDTIYFKICRGNWKATECDSKGRDVLKHRFVKGWADTVHVNIDAWRDIIPTNQIAKTENKNVRFVPTQIDMPQLGKKRTIRIYLPPNYFKYKAFPVIYMHDAQNIFDNSTSLTRSEWHVDEILDALHYSRGFSVIVVGIYCDENDRTNEFTPWDNDQMKVEGEGDKYAKFIIKTLKPFVDDHYRSNNKREQTAIIGSGLGGLVSLYTALEYPDVFGCAAAISPVVDKCPKAYEYFSKIRSKKPQQFYISAGQNENEEMVQSVENLVKSLENAGFDTLNIKANITPHGQSVEWYWGEEFKNALNFFYNLKLY